MIAVIVLYGFAFGSWIFVQEIQHIHKKLARTLSLPIWFFVIAHGANLFGPLRVFAFAGSAILLTLISAGFVSTTTTTTPNDAADSTSNASDTASSSVESFDDRKPSKTSFDDETGMDKALSGDAHLRIIGSLCFLLWTVHHDIVLTFILMPFLIALFLKSGE